MLKSRKLFALLLTFCAAAASAQDPKITRVTVGFSGLVRSSQWTPVTVEMLGGDVDADCTLFLQGHDADGAEHVTRIPFRLEPWAPKKIVAPIKSFAGSDQGAAEFVRVWIEIGNRRIPAPAEHQPFRALEEKQLLLVALGGSVPALEALVQRERAALQAAGDDAKKNASSLAFWHVGRVLDVGSLPDQWFGYQAADAVVINTGDDRFMTALSENPLKGQALRNWVLRGGKLIVALDAKNARELNAPDLPVLFKLNRKGHSFELARSTNNSVFDWGLNKILPREIEAVALDPVVRNWDVWAQYQDADRSVPLIVRVPYGFGAVTTLAFPLDAIAVPDEGKEKNSAVFFTNLLARQRERPKESPGDSLGAGLGRDLDRFDVPLIPFHWIALFILLYLLAIGPIEYLVLKKLNRLEWTWFAFPLTIALTCGLAYYYADRVMPRELKVNQIDLVDIDLRTAVQPYLAGHSYFTVLTPGITNLSVGVESRTDFWTAPMDSPLPADQPIWLGRSEQEFRSGGFLKQPYEVDAKGRALTGISMNVRTTKSFVANWGGSTRQPPLACKLTYPVSDNAQVGVKLSGTIRNDLAFDLVDAWLIYDTYAYALPGGLPVGKDVAVKVDLTRGERLPAWIDLPDAASALPEKNLFSAAKTMKRLAFFDQAPVGSNAGFAALDWSWRLRAAPQAADKTQGEAILYARVKSMHGEAETLMKERLPTRLWLGPVEGQRPPQPGQLTQEIYVRVLLPVNPAEDP